MELKAAAAATGTCSPSWGQKAPLVGREDWAGLSAEGTALPFGWDCFRLRARVGFIPLSVPWEGLGPRVSTGCSPGWARAASTQA